MIKKVSVFIISVIMSVLSASIVKADRATSTNFILESAVVDSGGEDASSTSFRLPSAFGQPSTGLSTSSTFRLEGGFLAFPIPVVAVTPVVPGIVSLGTGIGFFLPFPPVIVPCAPVTDLNCDGRINLIDLSIFLYFSDAVPPTPVDFNKDSSIDTRDLSVLFSDWTDRVLAFADESPPLRERVFREGDRGFAAIGEIAEAQEEPGLEKIVPEAEPQQVGPTLTQRIVGVLYRVFERTFNFVRSIFR